MQKKRQHWKKIKIKKIKGRENLINTFSENIRGMWTCLSQHELLNIRAFTCNEIIISFLF